MAEVELCTLSMTACVMFMQGDITTSVCSLFSGPSPLISMSVIIGAAFIIQNVWIRWQFLLKLALIPVPEWYLF